MQRNIIPKAAQAPQSGFQLPAGAHVISDVSYGPDPAQRFDVYIPSGVKRAPVIFMVHGGGWTGGDKENPNVIANKVPYFLGLGFVFITTNYRMVPEVGVMDEAADVAAAIAYAQKRAADWNADANEFVLMGHSAGANLVTLLQSEPAIQATAGCKPVLGSVILDSAAYDVPAIMVKPHLSLYDTVFGTDRALWKQASPLLQLASAPAPMLLVASTERNNSVDQATAFSKRVAQFGGDAELFPVAMSHSDINLDVGAANALTKRIAQFLGALKANH